MDFPQDTARWQNLILCVFTTECVEDLDQQSEMIIFESILKLAIFLRQQWQLQKFA
jgi:hypothetical protein